MTPKATTLPRLPPWAVFGIPLLCWVTLLQLHSVMPQNEALVMYQGWRVTGSASTPPQASRQDWKAITLTDDWWRALPHTTGAWYRFEIDLDVAPDRLWGIYLPRAAVNAAVWLNGELIGTGGHLTRPITINWNRPLYFLIPNGLLQPGSNELQIQLVSDLEGFGLLRPFYLGSDETLAPYYHRRYFVDVTVVEIITVFMATMGAFMSALWWLRRESVYGWFAFSVVVWAVHHLSLLVPTPLLPAPAWWWLWYVTVGWAVVGTVFFVSRFLAVSRPVIERGVLTAATIGSVAIAFTASDGYWLRWFGSHLWHTLTLLFGAYSTYIVLHAWRRHLDKEVSWLIMSGLLVFSFGIHDWLVTNQWLARDEGLFIQYSAPLVLLVFGWILLMRFVGALTFAETLNRDLETRVATQVAAAEAQHHEISRLERLNLLAEERERLMRDMHDGLGGHLISTISLIDGAQPTLEEVGRALRAALDDLRLVINSMDPYLEDLATALGDLRDRLGARLQAAGIDVHWKIGELPAIKDLGPERVLQILRIVQEAITNILKHAGATQVSIEAEVHSDTPSDNLLTLRIRDNGVGFEATKSNGRGLTNMQHRAQRIGATLAIDSMPGATAVSLNLPLPPVDHFPAQTFN